ncbi:MAG TPA: glycosyltransferase, partial [Candidatus Paceibacterota bacterium]
MRLRAYAAVLGEVHAISVAPGHTNDVHEGALHLYPIQASRLLRIPALARRARVLIRERGIEVVSAQDPFEHGLIAWKAVLGTNARLHIQLHTDPFARDFANVGHPMSYINFVRLLIMSFVLRRAARIRVVSARLAREMRERYHPRAPITILPIYTDLARFRSVVRAREQGSLLWIGRFEKEKNPMLALAALAAVRSIGIDAHLTLLGAGRLELPLRLRAKELGVDTHVTFPGFVDPLPYLAKAEL